jgi:hypothetical protein
MRDSKDLFSKFFNEKEAIMDFLGVQLEWIEADKACRILTLTDGDIKKGTSSWQSMFEWYCDMSLRFKEMAKKFDI